MACSSRSFICCGVADTVVIACSVRSGGWREESSEMETRRRWRLKGRRGHSSGGRPALFSVTCEVDVHVYFRFLTWGGKCVRYVGRRLLPARRSCNSLPAAGSLHGLLLHAGIRRTRRDVLTSPCKHRAPPLPLSTRAPGKPAGEVQGEPSE